MPITEGHRGGLSKLVAEAEAGHAVVLTRRAVPVAAVVNFAEAERLTELGRDLVDVALVLSRAATDTGRRTSLDDALAEFGFSRDQLEAMDDPA